MAVTFPTTLDTFANPTSTDKLNSPSHSSQHSDENDAIEALEAKVGVDSSAVVTSLDYKLTNASSSNPGHKHTLANGATDVTSTAAEVNTLHSSGVTNDDLVKLHAVTATSTELNYTDVATAGTAEASKAAILDPNKDFNFGTGDVTATIGTFTSLSTNYIRGFMVNGKLSVTVASNNLTVALKTIAGTDPSATDPVYIRIGDTVRSVTAALSVTKNAGTNWCNSGSSELATYIIDYFVYVGYNATDGVVIGFSRIPFAHQYSSFSATSTNETYCAISTITNAAATDYYEVVGRFAATLSAGAGYTWTVPTFTALNLIQRPIYATRWLTFAPTLVGWSAAPTNTIYVYRVENSYADTVYRQGTGNTSNSTSTTMTMPFSVPTWTNFVDMAFCSGQDNGVSIGGRGVIQSASRTVIFNPAVSGGVWTGSGTKRIGTFRIRTPLSDTL